MAATLNSRATYHVFGDLEAVVANVTFTTTGDTLDVGLHNVVFATSNGFSAALTSITNATRTSQNTIPLTFNGTGGTFEILALGY